MAVAALKPVMVPVTVPVLVTVVLHGLMAVAALKRHCGSG